VFTTSFLAVVLGPVRGLSPILPNGNGIAVLCKRFEFASADGLEEFLADLSEYEEKKQVRLRSIS